MPYITTCINLLHINMVMAMTGLNLTSLGQKRKKIMLPSPDQNLKIGSVGQDFFFFFLTYRERVEFSNIFFKVSKWGKLGRNAVKTHIYKSCKCFFKPLNTNFGKFFAQIW